MQLLRERDDDGNGNPILAAVGQLQFDVVQHRMKNEYGCDTKLEPIGYSSARWAEGGWEKVDAAKAEGILAGAYMAKVKSGTQRKAFPFHLTLRLNRTLPRKRRTSMNAP